MAWITPTGSLRLVMTSIAMFAIGIAFGFLSFSPSSAHHYAGATGEEGCSAVNAPQVEDVQHYYYDTLQSESITALDWNRSNNVNPTQMHTRRQDNYTSVTDVWVGDRYYVDYCGSDWYQGASDPDGGGVVGKGNCARRASPTGRCEQHDLRFNNYFTDLASTGNMRGLACHEQGHVLGLNHRAAGATGTCMPQDYPKPANAYDDHDRVGINQNS